MCGRFSVQFDRQVRTARAVAAADAQVVVELRDLLDRRERHEVGDRMRLGDADQFLHGPNAAFLHQEGGARFKFADDAVAVLRGNRAELHGLDAKGEEIHGGLVVHWAAVARDLDPLRHCLCQRQIGNGSDAVAAHADDHAFLPASSAAPGRKASVGKELARVTPAFLSGYLSSTLRMARRIGTTEVTAAVSLKSFGTSGHRLP